MIRTFKVKVNKGYEDKTFGPVTSRSPIDMEISQMTQGEMKPVIRVLCTPDPSDRRVLKTTVLRGTEVLFEHSSVTGGRK